MSDEWMSLSDWAEQRLKDQNMGIAERLKKVLEVYEGAENCEENRAKVKTLIREELPFIAEEDLDTAIDGILEKE